MSLEEYREEKNQETEDYNQKEGKKKNRQRHNKDSGGNKENIRDAQI